VCGTTVVLSEMPKEATKTCSAEPATQLLQGTHSYIPTEILENLVI